MWARFRANLTAAEEAMKAAEAEPFVIGSTGQPVEHPGFKTAARCDALALRLYKELTDGQVPAIAGVIANNGHSSSSSSSPSRTRPRLASR